MRKFLLLAVLFLAAGAAAAAPLLDDQVARGRPLDLAPAAFDPVDDFFARFDAQEKSRLRALREQYPGSDPIDGKYDPQGLRAWRRRFFGQQARALAGAGGDAALDYCRALGTVCDAPAAKAAATAAGLLFNGLHWKAPLGPLRAGIDTPPALRLQTRRIRLSVGYLLVF